MEQLILDLVAYCEACDLDLRPLLLLVALGNREEVPEETERPIPVPAHYYPH